MEISIRSANDDDLPAIQAIAEEAYAVYVPAIGKKPAPMVADYARHLQQDTCFVAEDQDRSVLGYAVVFFLDGAGEDKGYWLDSIAVAPEAAGQGLGSRLIDRVEAFLLSAGARSYQLYTNRFMTANVGWYQRLGFEITDEREEQGYQRIYFRKKLV
ncbi:GNAT family N-acetyltransferase [Kiloniella sp. b19]|uniref:GNAT family N-acetyltransferase n=1 Tax=Kiloniella sp. GXU_MW_B19 TaxID=3141326 RepID=UPI0031E261A6